MSNMKGGEFAVHERRLSVWPLKFLPVVTFAKFISNSSSFHFFPFSYVFLWASVSLCSVFCPWDWLLGPAPGAETLANSGVLHCVGWKKGPSCEVSVRLGLINEQTGRQPQLSLSFLSWINEAFLKDTPRCFSHWSNIPQHLTLPNFL